MNKHIYKTLLLSALTLPVLVGCDMDQYPDTSIPNEQSFKTFTDATNFERNFYSNFRGICAQGWSVYDIMVDYYQPSINFANRNGDYYTWQTTSSSFAGIWQANYSAITDYNNFLNNYSSIPLDSTKNQKAEMERYVGEAYFGRAYAYSNMVNGYCKEYNPATAEKDLGLPLVTKVDINEKPARASLKATYDFIREDLKKASELIKNTSTTNGQFSIYLVDALAARVNLMMKDYQGAYDKALEVINSGKFALAENAESFAQMWQTDQGSEFIFVPFQAAPNERSYEWSSPFCQYNSVEKAYSPDFLLSKATLDLYDGNDIRRTVFFKSVPKVVEKDAEATNIELINKYPGNPALAQSSDDKGTLYNAPKPFRLAELYLIAAEAAYRLNNMENANKYLNALRKARGLAEETYTSKTFFPELKNEWKREFLGEGKYFFCLKRWGEGFTRDAESQNSSIIFQVNPQTNIALTIKANNPGWIFELPSNDLQTNKNLIPNRTN